MEGTVVVSGLVVERGAKEVLHGLDLTVSRGRVTGLLGPSGSGKTTLMRTIVGVQIVRSGTVTVLGEPAGSEPLRARIGYQTQAPSVYRDLSVEENLSYFSRIVGASGERVAEVISRVALGGHEKQLVASLSGGEEARVSLAAALLGRPDILVLDEPTVGLDPVLRRDLWDLFRSLAAGGATLLVSSHVMDEADRCDDLVLLRDGSVLATGTPDDIRASTGEESLDAAFLALVEAGRA
jgi:ABC-2 type transport system ATP-binding protein